MDRASERGRLQTAFWQGQNLQPTPFFLHYTPSHIYSFIMKRITGLVAILILGASLLVGCTDNFRARHFGGTMTIQIPAGNKVINATWKEHDFWYLYRPALSNEVPATLTFKEYSSKGILSGTVLLQEH